MTVNTVSAVQLCVTHIWVMWAPSRAPPHRGISHTNGILHATGTATKCYIQLSRRRGGGAAKKKILIHLRDRITRKMSKGICDRFLQLPLDKMRDFFFATQSFQVFVKEEKITNYVPYCTGPRSEHWRLCSLYYRLYALSYCITRSFLCLLTQSNFSFFALNVFWKSLSMPVTQ